jgi:hypothetical protein
VGIALDDYVLPFLILALTLHAAASHLVCDSVYAIAFAAIRG